MTKVHGVDEDLWVEQSETEAVRSAWHVEIEAHRDVVNSCLALVQECEISASFDYHTDDTGRVLVDGTTCPAHEEAACVCLKKAVSSFQLGPLAAESPGLLRDHSERWVIRRAMDIRFDPTRRPVGAPVFELEARGCPAGCPKYSLKLFADGTLIYVGRERVPNRGTTVGSVPRERVDRVSRIARELLREASLRTDLAPPPPISDAARTQHRNTIAVRIEGPSSPRREAIFWRGASSQGAVGTLDHRLACVLAILPLSGLSATDNR